MEPQLQYRTHGDYRPRYTPEVDVIGELETVTRKVTTFTMGRIEKIRFNVFERASLRTMEADVVYSADLAKIEMNSFFRKAIMNSWKFRYYYYGALFQTINLDVTNEVRKLTTEFFGEFTDIVENSGQGYEDVLRKYVKLSASKGIFASDVGSRLVGGTVNVANFIKGKLRKLTDMSFSEIFPDFHVKAIALVLIWTRMLYALSKVNKLAWTINQVVNLAITVVIAMVQVFVSESPWTKPYVSGAKMICGSFSDVIAYMPEDIKKKFPSRLKNLAPDWQCELGEAAGIENLRFDPAMNMLYTFRVGDSYVRNIKGGLSIKSMARALAALSPFPMFNEMDAVVLLFKLDKIYY